MSKFTRRVLIAGLLVASVSGATVGVAGAQGKGNGNGNSGGNGNGGNNGNGRGNNGSSNAAGNGNGKGGLNGDGTSGTAGGMRSADRGNPSNKGTAGSSNLRIRHDNGFEETLARGRYTMKDNRGRTIVNRTAGPSDYARLRRLTGN